MYAKCYIMCWGYCGKQDGRGSCLCGIYMTHRDISCDQLIEKYHTVVLYVCRYALGVYQSTNLKIVIHYEEKKD